MEPAFRNSIPVASEFAEKAIEEIREKQANLEPLTKPESSERKSLNDKVEEAEEQNRASNAAAKAAFQQLGKKNWPNNQRVERLTRDENEDPLHLVLGVFSFFIKG